MLVRQVLTGVGGGAALASVALFLTIPRSDVEEGLPAWLKRKLPPATATPEVSETQEQFVAASVAEPSGERAVDGGRGISGLNPLEDASELAAQRVAGWGIGQAADAEDIAQQDEFSEEEHAPAVDTSEDLDPNLHLGALSKQTVIRREPDPDAPIIGFARTGALLRRAAKPSGFESCKQGWYRVEPDGYVCVGSAATLDEEHPILRLSSFQPDRSLGLPYLYGKSRYPTPPLYTRIPTLEQQKTAEHDLVTHRTKNFESLWADQADTPPPSLLKEGARIPRPFGYPILDHDFMTGRALGSSAFAFIDLFEEGGRKWGLTADLSLLPLDRLTPVEESDFFGVVLQDAADLPVAFVRKNGEYYYERKDGKLRPTRAIEYRSAFHLTGRREDVYGTTYLETKAGGYIREHERLVLIEKRESLPKWAKNRRSWLEVSVLNQTLIAYVGETPVFATLVSTGKDGLGDPETTHSTITGTFLIHTKHVTSTMSGDEADDEFDLRDVPYVQYFHGGYALHAAFWHDGFGTPRSHGCINLSPADARHLFSVTEPAVPLRWHSALSRHGTLVYIHP